MSLTWITLLGGLAFFFYGLSSVRKGLHVATSGRVKAVLGKITSNRFMAAIFGAVITLVLQSSGATSAMLVSFAQSKLIGVMPAVAVMLGADIGTTFVVILLSIKKIAELGLLIVAIGFCIEALAPSKRGKRWGSVILGFGLVFYGLKLMVMAAAPLKDNPLASYAFTYLADSPWMMLILASFIASVIHSAGTIGIAIALSFAGVINLQAAVPIVLGANLGTCVTAVIASFGSSGEGRQVAGAHILSKVIGVLLLMPFVGYITTLLSHITGDVPFQIALSHVLFNVALAIIFLPLLTPFMKLIGKLIPIPKEQKKAFAPKYLDRAALEIPALAFAQVKREILRMAGIVRTMVGDSLKLFSRGLDIHEEIERIRNMDDKVDKLEKAIRFYLAELGQENLPTEDRTQALAFLSIASDLEEIGDTISKELVMLGKKKARWHRLFSEEGWKDLREFQARVEESFDLAISNMANPSPELVTRIINHDTELQDVEQELRQAHLERLSAGLQESFDTSSIHLDILASLRRISYKLVRLAQMEITETEKQ